MAQWRSDRNLAEILTRLRSEGLVAEQHSLRSNPDHWHVRKPGEKGVLELTASQGGTTLEVRSNRQGDWIEGAVRATLD